MEGARRLRTMPVASSSRLYDPRPGSIRLFLEMPRPFVPVILFLPALAPGSRTSVGWSKLCHNITSDDGLSMMARFPVFKRTAALVVFLLPVPVVILLLLAMLVDQITDLLLPARFIMKTSRLPLLASFSCVWLMLGPVIGTCLLATHTVVNTGILWNHMPRYQPVGLGEVVVFPDLLRAPGAAGWNWKKPRANLPFLETSLSPTVSTLLTARVSFVIAAEHGVLYCRAEKKRNKSSMWWPGMESVCVQSQEKEEDEGTTAYI
jgi:hypothetical protein